MALIYYVHMIGIPPPVWTPYTPGQRAVHAARAPYARRAQEVCSTANVWLMTEWRIYPCYRKGLGLYGVC
jgi:hypothetical protein